MVGTSPDGIEVVPDIQWYLNRYGSGRGDRPGSHFGYKEAVRRAVLIGHGRAPSPTQWMRRWPERLRGNSADLWQY
jgi:hypothetical protein